jgi:glutaredoxin
MVETTLRVALVKRGCPHCFEAVKAINYVNKFLKEFKQIKIFDNYEFEEFGFKSHPIMDKFDPKDFDGYPYIYIDGIEVGPGPTELLIITIAKIVEEDLIMGLTMEAIEIG